jgi:hypothetical protein
VTPALHLQLQPRQRATGAAAEHELVLLIKVPLVDFLQHWQLL